MEKEKSRPNQLSKNGVERNPIKKIIETSEDNSKKIQAEANQRIFQEQMVVLETVEAVFQNLGQNEWTIEDHMEKGQYERLCKAVEEELDLEIRNLDYETKTAKFLRPAGLVYDVSLNRCTCADLIPVTVRASTFMLLQLRLAKQIQLKRRFTLSRLPMKNPLHPHRCR